MIQEVIEQFLKLDTELAEEVRHVLKELKDKMIEEEQARIDVEKKKNKNKKGWVEPILDTEKLVPRIPDAFLPRIFQWRLSQNDCRYRGYVLDGFPRNYDSSMNLFVNAKDCEKFLIEEKEREALRKPKEKGAKGTIIEDNIDWKRKFELLIEHIPQTVVFLHAGDEFLKERCKGLGATVVGTHYTDEGMIRRLIAYRKMKEENPARNILSFYRDNEFETLDLNIDEKKTDEEFLSEITKFIERVFRYLLLMFSHGLNRKDHSKRTTQRIRSWN